MISWEIFIKGPIKISYFSIQRYLWLILRAISKAPFDFEVETVSKLSKETQNFSDKESIHKIWQKYLAFLTWNIMTNQERG